MFNFFKKATPNPAAASAEGDAPPGEVEKVARIQQLCWVAGMRGESIAGLSEADLQDEHMQYELNRFTKFQHEAINLAREITDTFYRDAALDLLIGSYLKTGYEAEAKRLYEIIEIDIIQDKVRKVYPRLAAKF